MPKIILVKHKHFPLYFAVNVPEEWSEEQAKHYYTDHTCPINIYNEALFVVDLTAVDRDFLDPHECFEFIHFKDYKENFIEVKRIIDQALLESKEGDNLETVITNL